MKWEWVVFWKRLTFVRLTSSGSDLFLFWVFWSINECKSTRFPQSFITTSTFLQYLSEYLPATHQKACYAHHRVLLIQYSDCKTPPTSANLFHWDIPAHQEPCSTFGSMPRFCIFDGALAAEGECGGTVETERTAGFLCDVCCEITAASPEETQTAQCESALHSLLLLARAGHYLGFLILPAAHSFLWSDFYFVWLHCSFISFTSQSYNSCILMWMPSQWPVDGVKRQSAHTLNSSLMTHQQLPTVYRSPAAEL